MKKIVVVMSFSICSQCALCQSQEAQQLLLNWEKLMQFKKILRDMYKGWKIIENGYKNIKEVSSGNFSLHKGFLDALMEVSPAVRQYGKIGDIIKCQSSLLKQCKKAFDEFEGDDIFNPTEIDHIAGVYRNLLRESVKNLDELVLVITSGELRMNDEERISAIDRIYERVMDQYFFLRDFNSSTAYLSLQRKGEKAEDDLLKKIHGY
jgi:hypothetical protein